MNDGNPALTQQKTDIHWLAVTVENTIILQCSNHERGMLGIPNMSNAKVQSNNHHGKGETTIQDMESQQAMKNVKN